MTPNEIAEAARVKIAKEPHLEKPMRDEWSKVEEFIDARVLKSKKKWKVYEAAHLHRVARLEMLTKFVEGRSASECAASAFLLVEGAVK